MTRVKSLNEWDVQNGVGDEEVHTVEMTMSRMVQWSGTL